MNHDNFDDILNECIDRLLAGETVEQCLSTHTEHALELDPLLRSAAAAHKASSLQPDLDFKSRARSQILSRVHSTAPRKDGRRPRRLPLFGWQPRWAVTTILVFLCLLVAGSSTVAASNGSMPDDTLYSTKLRVENVRLRLARSDEAKAKLHAKFAERRVKEIIHLAEKDGGNENNSRQIETAKSRLRERLQALQQLASARQGQLSEDAARNDPKLIRLRQILQQNQSTIQSAFQEAASRLPLRARLLLQSALQEYQQQYQQALEATGDASANSANSSDQLSIRDRLQRILGPQPAIPTTQ